MLFINIVVIIFRTYFMKNLRYVNLWFLSSLVNNNTTCPKVILFLAFLFLLVLFLILSIVNIIAPFRTFLINRPIILAQWFMYFPFSIFANHHPIVVISSSPCFDSFNEWSILDSIFFQFIGAQ